MENKKYLIIGLVLMVGIIGVFSIQGKASCYYRHPLEALSGLTGKSEMELWEERRNTGKTYGEIANDNGKIEEFRDLKMDIQRDRLNEAVESGRMTQEEVDGILNSIEERQAYCNGQGFRTGHGGRGIGRGRGMGCRF